MKVTRFYPPYQPNGKTTFPEAQKKSGVYLIKKDKKLVYVGYSETDLYKTMYRHFQSWNDPTQYRVTYQKQLKKHSFTVRIIFCTPGQAKRLEAYLILRYTPEDNINGMDDMAFTPPEMKSILAAGEQYDDTPATFVPF